jgi:hypothetical protein
MGLTQPRQLIVNVDEDNELVPENVTWGYKPALILTIAGTGEFDVKTIAGWTDKKIVVALARALQTIVNNGDFPYQDTGDFQD